MRILDLHISGFGKLRNRDFTFESGLNVVYGHNEAGKSTLHTFIRGMLFGIEKQRGRASKNDLYNKYEPWAGSGTYEGWMRVESQGEIFRIERRFLKKNQDLRIINETLGKEEQNTKAVLERICCGLTETAYNNTISIGQLKCATDSGMVAELRNYIANLNTSGSIALNITKASAYLKSQRRQLEAQLLPQAALNYTTVLGEIRKLEQESPNILDLVLGHQIDLIIDIPAQGAEHGKDGLVIRRNAIETGVHVLTSLDTANALATSLENRAGELTLIDIATVKNA